VTVLFADEMGSMELAEQSAVAWPPAAGCVFRLA
jgi:hypothetical protein